jgi:hypothetical protein
MIQNVDVIGKLHFHQPHMGRYHRVLLSRQQNQQNWDMWSRSELGYRTCIPESTYDKTFRDCTSCPPVINHSYGKWWFSIVTFPQSNVAMEHPPSVDDFPSSVWLPEGIPSGKLTLCELENHNV